MTYTREQIARQLTLSVKTIDRLILRGQLKALKIGRSVRISQDQLDEFLKGSVYDPFKNNGVSITTGFNI